jgi:predicted metal-dependent hydrolase
MAPANSPLRTTPSQDVLPFEAAQLPGQPVAFIRHPTARRYVIRVRLDGSVRVTIPRWGSKRAAAEFVARQGEWIAEQQVKVARARERRRPAMPKEQVQALRARARNELPPRLLALAERFGLTVTKISIRNQRWRWGSCSRQGHICLNWRLVDMPDAIRDYVLIHELMHLKRMDHSPAFWKQVAAACPEYQQARAWLRRHANTISED